MLQHPTGHAGIFVRHEQSAFPHPSLCHFSSANSCKGLPEVIDRTFLAIRSVGFALRRAPAVAAPGLRATQQAEGSMWAAPGCWRLQSTQWGAGGHFAPIRGQVSEVAELSYSQAMTRQFSLCLDEPVGYVCWRTIICPCWQVPSSHFSSSIYVLQCMERENELKPIKKTLRKEIL